MHKKIENTRKMMYNVRVYKCLRRMEGSNLNILIATDSYKGSLDSEEVAKCIRKGVSRVFPDAQFQILAIADGGEGTVDSILKKQNGRYETVQVLKPNGGNVQARYGILKNKTAILEMAAASGLPLVTSEEKDVMKATTYGTGQLVKAALDHGCRNLYIGIGGSATNDAGVGMAQALGASFRDRNGKEIGFGGGELEKIEEIDLSGMDERLKETKITVMCDVINPLYGPEGAAGIYGRQKGATDQQIQQLDVGMKHLADLMSKKTKRDSRWEKGAGAAGGLGWGFVVFTGAKLLSGIGAILELVGFEEKCRWADLVITGEGKIDVQSVCGKVIDGISAVTTRYQKPLIAVAGSIDDDFLQIYEKGVEAMEACVMRPMSIENALEKTRQYLPDAAERIMRAVRVGLQMKEKEAM